MAIVDSKKYTLTGAQVKDLVSRIKASDAKVLTNAGAPTTSTVGTVGQLLEDTTNGKLYICTAVTPGTDPDPDTYTWTEVGTGSGSGITTLTSADYNWPATGTKTGLAHWLLEPGIYKIDNSQGSSDFTIYLDSTTTGKVSAGTESVMVVSSYIAYNNKEHSVIEAVMTSGGYPGVWSADARKDDPSLESNIGRVLKSSYVVDNLTSTSTVLPLSAKQGKVLNEKIEGRVKTNAGAPTTSTVGTVGMLLEDTTNGKVYICTDATNPYIWEEVGAGGPTVVQTTGISTTDVMSQNATTSMVFADPSTKEKVQIGNNSSATGLGAIAIGDGAIAQDVSVAIGYDCGEAGIGNVFVGNGIGDSDYGSGTYYRTGMGWNAGPDSYGAVAIGASSSVGTGSRGSVAIGYQAQVPANTPGVVQIGTADNASGYGGNSSYRLLTGLYDPINAHDAATKGYVDGKILQNAGAPTTSTVGTVGQLLEDTTNGKLYICTDATNPYVWEEVGTGGASNVMVLYTNKDLPDSASSSYHIYSDVALTTTVNTYDVYNFAMAGGTVLLVVPDSRDASRIYSAKVCPLHEIDYDTDDSFYRATFLVKASMLDAPKYYHYYGSTGEWGGKETFIDAVSPSALNSIIATNAGAPTTSTVGTVGQLLEDTTNGKLYICTAVSGSTYTWTEVDYSGLTTLSYGISTWNDFITAYNAGKIVYCRASSNSNPATGTQGRMAFMAYINNPTTPTEVEFQYVRSVSSKTASQPCDQVFVYKLTNVSGGTWTVESRNMTYKVAAGTNVTTSYSNGTVTINATDTTYSDFAGATSSAAGTAGLVPAPASGETSKYLKSDGTWGTITVPTVNNATLTIQKNGTSVGTFTANASSNVTANIEVPVITMTSTDPGEGGALAANNFIAVYNAS